MKSANGLRWDVLGAIAIGLIGIALFVKSFGMEEGESSVVEPQPVVSATSSDATSQTTLSADYRPVNPPVIADK